MVAAYYWLLADVLIIYTTVCNIIHYFYCWLVVLAFLFTKPICERHKYRSRTKNTFNRGPLVLLAGSPSLRFWGVMNKMDEIKQVKNAIKKWQADIDEHRGGFLASDRERAFVVAFMKEISAAQKALNALVKSLEGKSIHLSFLFLFNWYVRPPSPYLDA